MRIHSSLMFRFSILNGLIVRKSSFSTPIDEALILLKVVAIRLIFVFAGDRLVLIRFRKLLHLSWVLLHMLQNHEQHIQRGDAYQSQGELPVLLGFLVALGCLELPPQFIGSLVSFFESLSGHFICDSLIDLLLLRGSLIRVP